MTNGNDAVDASLLNDFISRFLGYGNPNAELWFVGMEEGGDRFCY